jgi:hypothetical protein
MFQYFSILLESVSYTTQGTLSCFWDLELIFQEAAAKITEVTRAKEKEKEEKYGKFLRDLHCRVASSAKEKQLLSLSQIPKVKLRGQVHGRNDGPAPQDKARDLSSKNQVDLQYVQSRVGELLAFGPGDNSL